MVRSASALQPALIASTGRASHRHMLTQLCPKPRHGEKKGIKLQRGRQEETTVEEEIECGRKRRLKP